MLAIVSCGDTGTSSPVLTSLTYSAAPLNAEIGVQISDMTPTLAPDGASGIYTVSPPLPEGLILHETSGVISGTPTVLHNSTVHTVTAKGNEAYSGTVTADITVEVFSEIEAVEIPKRATTDIRDSYVLFSISADQLKTDYHLAVKEAAKPAPTPAEMSSGALKRNIGTESINVLIAQRLNAPMIDFAKTYFTDNSQTTLGTNMRGLYLQNDFGFVFDNTAVGAEAWVAESILKESTEYALYGMENGGTQVIRLLTVTTDSTLDSPTASDNTLTLVDTTLERGHIEIAVNANEYYIFPHQSELNPTIGDIILDFDSSRQITTIVSFILQSEAVFGSVDRGYSDFLYLFKTVGTGRLEAMTKGGYVLVNTGKSNLFHTPDQQAVLEFAFLAYGDWKNSNIPLGEATYSTLRRQQ